MKKHTIKYLPVDAVKPYDRNPRINDGAVEYVASSIREFGFQNPLIIDKDSVIICGHTRLKAAQSIGLDTVPCIIADELTPAQVKAYRLADNRLGELSEWNPELMKLELQDLEQMDISIAPLGMGATFARAFLPVEISPVASSSAPADSECGYEEEQEEQEEQDCEEALPSVAPGKLCICPRCGMQFELKSGGEE